MADRNSATLSPLVSRERAGNAFASALRLYIGRGRRYSVKQVANATGVKDRVIECAMIDAGSVDYRAPAIEAILSLSAFLGADFTSEWLKLAEQGAFDLPDDDDPSPLRLAVESAEDNASLLHIAADGVVDEHESRDVVAIGTRKIARGHSLVAMGHRARRRVA